MIFSEGSHSGLSVVDTFGTHSVDRQYNACESYTQELIWCNFKLLHSVWGTIITPNSTSMQELSSSKLSLFYLYCLLHFCMPVGI